MTAILRSLAEWLTEWKMKWAEISYPPVRMKGRVCVCGGGCWEESNWWVKFMCHKNIGDPRWELLPRAPKGL